MALSLRLTVLCTVLIQMCFSQEQTTQKTPLISTVDDVTAHDNVTSRMVPEEPVITLQDLLDAKYYLTVIGRPCQDKLATDGYLEHLKTYDKYCLCYGKACGPAGVTMSADHEQALRDYEKELNEQRKKTVTKSKYSAENLPETIGTAVAYSLIMIVGLVGNILVLVTVGKFIKRTSATNIFIASVSAGDIMILIVVLPFQLGLNLYGFWPLGPVSCKIINYLYFVSFSCSSFSLMALSVERYIVICHPIKAQSISTPSRAAKIVAAVWVASMATAAPSIPMVTIVLDTCGPSLEMTTYSKAFYTATAVVVFLVPLIVMSWAYISVSLALAKPSKSLQHKKTPYGEGEKNDKGKSEEDIALERVKVIKMLVSVLVLFAFCWGPYWGVRLRQEYMKTESDSHTMFYRDLVKGLQALAYFNSAVNPIIYAFASKPFRRGFARACCCLKNKKLHGEYTLSSKTVSTGDILQQKTGKMINSLCMEKSGEFGLLPVIWGSKSQNL